MSHLIFSVAGTLLLAMTPIAFAQTTTELASAHAQWTQGNYGTAADLYKAYLQKHDNEKPPPYEARAYYGASLCHIFGYQTEGHTKLMQVQESLDAERNRGDTRSIPASRVANLSTFVGNELSRCKPAAIPTVKTVSGLGWTAATNQLGKGSISGLTGKIRPRTQGESDSIDAYRHVSPPESSRR